MKDNAEGAEIRHIQFTVDVRLNDKDDLKAAESASAAYANRAVKRYGFCLEMTDFHPR